MVSAFRICLVALKDVRDEVYYGRLGGLSLIDMDEKEYKGHVEELNWLLDNIDQQIAKCERLLEEERN